MPKAADGPFPAVVFLHGEGWRAGNRRQMSHFIEGVARMGYVGVAAGVPARAGRALSRPGRGLQGRGALAAGQREGVPDSSRPHRRGRLLRGRTPRVPCSVSRTRKDGLEGDRRQSRPIQRRSGRRDLLRTKRFLDARLAQGSGEGSHRSVPGRYVCRQTGRLPKGFARQLRHEDAPPFLLFHGTEDELVPVDQSIRMAEKLKSVGVSPSSSSSWKENGTASPMPAIRSP